MGASAPSSDSGRPLTECTTSSVTDGEEEERNRPAQAHEPHGLVRSVSGALSSPLPSPHAPSPAFPPALSPAQPRSRLVGPTDTQKALSCRWLCWRGVGRGGRRFHLSPSVDSDGAGRSGTYILIDMVLNKMAKGETRSGEALLWLRAGMALLWQPGGMLTEAARCPFPASQESCLQQARLLRVRLCYGVWRVDTGRAQVGAG